MRFLTATSMDRLFPHGVSWLRRWRRDGVKLWSAEFPRVPKLGSGEVYCNVCSTELQGNQVYYEYMAITVIATRAAGSGRWGWGRGRGEVEYVCTTLYE